tara:strand:+ start:594 stop:1175 length:582 start_codon:yes stop_codon:yes gene_type:complete
MIRNYKQRLNLQSKKLKETFSNWGFSWAGLIDNRNGEWLLFAQLALITAHLIPPWPKSENILFMWEKFLIFPGYILIFLGFIFALKALINLGPSLSPLPEPKKYASLITSGAYKYCRHPLYQSLIILSLGVTLFYVSLVHLFIMLVLVIVLKKKAKREEKRLVRIHKNYRSYMNKTIAIIPGISYLDWRNLKD